MDNELERSSPGLALGISLLDSIPERAVKHELKNIEGKTPREMTKNKCVENSIQFLTLPLYLDPMRAPDRSTSVPLRPLVVSAP